MICKYYGIILWQESNGNEESNVSTIGARSVRVAHKGERYGWRRFVLPANKFLRQGTL